MFNVVFLRKTLHRVTIFDTQTTCSIVGYWEIRDMYLSQAPKILIIQRIGAI